MSIRVLVVDDQDLVRMGTVMVLGVESDMTVVGEAADGDSAVDRVRELRPDVVLMDVRMPGRDGIDATREITRTMPEVRVLVLTTFDLDEYAFAALNAGASGFLLKDAPPSELVAAIRGVAAGDAIVSPRATRAVLEQVRGTLPEGRRTVASSALDVLSAREREVLEAIGRGRTNTEIAAELFLSESTVKTHVGRVLAKLQLRDRVHAVIVAYEQGLV
ncbi:response regulator transcription factor [Curtobacterium sp. Leaf261]|uniref:response regulator transcription factor n=1 Tax=Curtobacterium sp. Leaf261 TaxID=1736311 RepID=UPI000702323C|nr:response regulator transcription factor [Curtobacterium sp. Leaf261]KQO61385.1 LuxR family transcriptional regulator [Curtobacterium sp. Leaf261]